MSVIESLYKWLEPGMIALVISVMIMLQVLAILPSHAQETGCVTEYVVQADDQLSTLADRYYGDASFSASIISATNRKHITDSAFASITTPQQIKAGDKLCIAN